MGTSKLELVLFLSITLVAGGFLGLCDHLKIKDLQGNQKKFIVSAKQNIKIAIKLQSIPIWYVVHENKVSSMPNGQGETVDLSDRSLFPIGNRRYIRPPLPNTKIRFSPNESMEQSYTVAGGLLAYEYIDD